MFDSMPNPQDRADYIAAQARNLIALAEELGVTVRISLKPLKPLATGNTAHVVEAWPARHGPKALD